MAEELPLSTVQQAILEILRGREDVVVFGAQAVNAYIGQPRMTQDVDLLSLRAAEFAQALLQHLADKFHIAIRLREVGAGRGYRLYQVRKTGNRHLVDLRPVAQLPAAQRISGVLVLAPADLIAYKTIAFHMRRGQPKSGTDWRDLALLLLKFPELKRDPGPVTDCLKAAGADEPTLAVWRELVALEIRPEDDDNEF